MPLGKIPVGHYPPREKKNPPGQNPPRKMVRWTEFPLIPMLSQILIILNKKDCWDSRKPRPATNPLL